MQQEEPSWWVRIWEDFKSFWIEDAEGVRTLAELAMFWIGILLLVFGIAVPDSWNSWTQRVLIFVGTLLLLYAPSRKYRLFKNKMDAQSAQIEELKKSKLSVSYDPSNLACRTPSVMAPNGGQSPNTFKAIFHRLIVKANCVGSITGCCGRITLIRFGNEPIMDHETLVLTFAPGDKANEATRTSKEIVDRANEKLDVIFITPEQLIVPCTPDFQLPVAVADSVMRKALFSRHGNYYFTIVVSGKETSSVEVVLKLNWQGDWEKAEMELISHS
jgi:hypothetical protein